MICQSCNKEKEMYVKGLCKSCYEKNRFANNPESYEKRKEAMRKWRKNNPDKVKNGNKIRSIKIQNVQKNQLEKV